MPAISAPNWKTVHSSPTIILASAASVSMIGLRQRPENNDLRMGRLIGGPCAYGI
jgi:hypothetical protein